MATATATATAASKNLGTPTAIVLGVLAVVSIANATWMLVAPMSWYSNVPADVPAFGPFNVHFVRDIGCAYLATGVGLLWGIRSPPALRGAVAVAALFYGLHALVHVLDTARGHVGPMHWLLDLPTTYVPAAILVAVLWRMARRPPASQTASASGAPARGG